jgi:hypothetical protein
MQSRPEGRGGAIQSRECIHADEFREGRDQDHLKVNANAIADLGAQAKVLFRLARRW